MNQSYRSEIRTLIRQKRRALDSAFQQNASMNLVQQASDFLPAHSQIIALYLSVDGELNTQPLIEWCWQQNHTVCLPVIDTEQDGIMMFYRYESSTVMQRNKFGIEEPHPQFAAPIAFDDIDIMFTPLVAFDAAGNRLGMGGGFYDRALEDWKHNKKPVPVGLAHDCQQVEAIPTEHWDVPLPILVTPTKIWRWDSSAFQPT